MRALIADDEATNRILLKRLLGRWGYEVVVAEDGEKAWSILNEEDAPRLAVLDWQMPGLDGVEICGRLKNGATGKYIYTVLVTHKSEKEDLAIGLDAGADDFIRKPLDPEELRSRLGVARRVLEYDAKLAETNSLLQQYAKDMEALAEERAQQLVHADRMATLGMLSAGVAHEVNNPATFISGNVQTLQRFWADVEPVLKAQVPALDGEVSAKLCFILEEFPSALTGIHNGVGRISKIVSGLKAYARHEKPSHSVCHVRECVERAKELCAFQVAKRGVTVNLHFAEPVPTVTGDAQQIEQVLINLFVNAADAMEGREHPQISVSCAEEEDEVVLYVQDNGPGIPAGVMQKVFNPFFTTKPAGKGTGLGLSICRRIAADHRGTLTVKNLEGSGARFRFALPARRKEAAA